MKNLIFTSLCILFSTLLMSQELHINNITGGIVRPKINIEDKLVTMDMNVNQTSQQTMKFTKQEKIQILREATMNGIYYTMEKYALPWETYLYWKKEFALKVD